MRHLPVPALTFAFLRRGRRRAAATRARYGLGSYLAFTFSLLSILVTAVLVLAIERSASGQVRSSIGSNLAELANQTATRLDRSMAERHREAGLVARRLSEIQDLPRVRRELEALQQTYPLYAWVGLADPSGRVLTATGGLLTGADVSKRPWFAQARDGVTVGDVHDAKLLASLLDKPGGEPMRFVDIAFPVTRDGREPDILGVHLSWTWSRDIRNSVFVPVGREHPAEPLIVARDGTVLLGPKGVEGTTLRLPSLERAKGATGYLTERWPDGKDYLVGYSHDVGFGAYPGLGWRVLVRQDLSTAYAPVRTLQLHLAGWGLAVAALFSLLGVLAAWLVTRPLKDLALAARELEASGSRTAPRAEPYREVAQLGDALDSLVRGLQHKEADLRELNASLERRVEERTAALREAFDKVRSNEERIHTILEAAPDPFVAIDPQGRIAEWNAAAWVLFGWTREEVLGRQLGDVLVPERFRRSADKLMDHFGAGSAFRLAGRTMERLVVDRAGREIAVELRVDRIETGESQLLCAFMHDVSERRAIERLKDEFVSTVSHELRTPLTAVYGTLRLLASGVGGPLPAQGQQLVEMSTRSCERLIRLINDMLDVERIASGRLELCRQRLDLRTVVERAMEDTRPYTDQLGVGVVLADGAPAWVEADGDRIIQVVVNLLSNAAKFSPRGGEVRIALQAYGAHARVTVEDHGSGIPPQFAARIFSRFAQADASDRREKGGTGLGLNICRSIVQAHGGTIGFESEPGVRTTFHFEIPLAG